MSQPPNLCQADCVTSSGIDHGKCLLPREAHEGECPYCHGTCEIETDEGVRGCMPCLTGLGPHGHDYEAAVAS